MNNTGQTVNNQSERLSRSQCEVLALACSLSMITYLDRVCFGAAVPYIIQDLGLRDISSLKWAFTAFTVAYAAFEIPSGWLGDTFGPRSTLLRIVAAWSVFTMLTGLVGLRVGSVALGGLGTLCVIRFLFGAGEAGAFPNLARAVANWFEPSKRGRAKGLIWMSGRFMGGVTPLVWHILVVGTAFFPPLVHWRTAFVLFGCIGLLWCLVFAIRFRDQPIEAIASPRNESLQASAKLSASKMLGDPNIWLLGGMYACASFSWYFNITYYSTYLETQHGLAASSTWGAILKGGPLLLGGIGCFVGGYATDWLMRSKLTPRWARRIPAMTGHLLCGICYLLAILAPNAWLAALAISGAAFFNDLMMGAAWSTCQDIGYRYTAVVSAWMNMLGNLGGALSGWAIGTLLEQSRHVSALEEHASRLSLFFGYNLCFAIFAGLSFFAAALWLGINSESKRWAEAS